MESRGQVRLSIPSLYWEHGTCWTSLSIFLNIIRWHRNCNMPGPISPSTQDVWPCYHLWCLLGWSLLVWYYSHLLSSECGPLPVAPQTEPDSGGMCRQKGHTLLQLKHSLRYTACEQLSPANEDTNVECCEPDMPDCFHPTESSSSTWWRPSGVQHCLRMVQRTLVDSSSGVS